jgi:penicillin-binding protein 1C
VSTLRERLGSMSMGRRTLAAALAGLLALLVLDRALPPPIGAVEVGAVVRDRHGAALRIFPIEGGRWRLAADLDAVDPRFVEALLAYEDRRFEHHPGVDPLAVVRAAIDAVRAARVVSGASTLTMQTARLLEPRERTLGAKLVEMLRAVQLELRLDKREILELYLTLAPYGGNLEGIRAASWAYFGREPDALAIDEIALLVALPQAPEARRPDLRPAAAVAARARVLDRLATAGLVDPGSAAESRVLPAPRRRAFPAHAWHAAAALRGAGGDVDSTLDRALQQRMRALLEDALPDDEPDVQYALLVVENEARAVRAAIGSASRSRPGGWIDLAARSRSPGSTLKPFIYGLAFDDGLATADTRILDLPRRFDGYRPENFERAFNGDVSVGEALGHSLNVPAVLALDRVGAARFSAALEQTGIDLGIPGSATRAPGLAIALGGLGMSARDLAVLYGALGTDGRARPLRWRAEDPLPDAGQPLLGAETAREIVEILRRAPQPDGRMPARLTDRAPDIAFKTGTSYGHRDAWAVGIADGYTIVVWSGRADGVPRPGVTGRQEALPILFDAFDGLTELVPTAARGHRLAERRTVTPRPLADFSAEEAPHILFPPDGAEVFFGGESRPLVLAGRGAGPLTWYVDGAAVPGAAEGGWRPAGPGFYRMTAVDGEGRAGSAEVRIVDHMR